MEIILPTIFDNRHEKYMWTIIPIILIAVLFVGFILPMMIFIGWNSVEIIMVFVLATFFCLTLGLWYHLTVPSFIILDFNVIVLDKAVKREIIPLDFVIRVKKISNGVLFLRMMDGREVFRSGIDNMILYHLINYINLRNKRNAQL